MMELIIMMSSQGSFDIYSGNLKLGNISSMNHEWMLRLNLSTVVKKVEFKAVDGSKGQKPLCYLYVTANFCWRIELY